MRKYILTAVLLACSLLANAQVLFRGVEVGGPKAEFMEKLLEQASIIAVDGSTLYDRDLGLISVTAEDGIVRYVVTARDYDNGETAVSTYLDIHKMLKNKFKYTVTDINEDPLYVMFTDSEESLDGMFLDLTKEDGHYCTTITIFNRRKL